MQEGKHLHCIISGQSWSKGSCRKLGWLCLSSLPAGIFLIPCSFSVWVPLGIFLQDFSQITANMARIALPFILTPVLEHFCQKSCSPILSLEMINCSLNPGVNASKFSSGGCLPKSMLIKINIDISSEFILEIQTISAKTDKNTLRPNQISGIGKFCPYSKEQKPRFRKAENQGKQGMGKGTAHSVQYLLDQRGGGVNTEIEPQPKTPQMGTQMRKGTQRTNNFSLLFLPHRKSVSLERSILSPRRSGPKPVIWQRKYSHVQPSMQIAVFCTTSTTFWKPWGVTWERSAKRAPTMSSRPTSTSWTRCWAKAPPFTPARAGTCPRARPWAWQTQRPTSGGF